MSTAVGPYSRIVYNIAWWGVDTSCTEAVRSDDMFAFLFFYLDYILAQVIMKL